MTKGIKYDIIKSKDFVQAGSEIAMMYPYMTLGDNTKITYSDAYYFNGLRCVDVFIERPTDDSLINVNIQMPFCKIKDSFGMSKKEIQYWIQFTQKNFTLIQEFSMRKNREVEETC